MVKAWIARLFAVSLVGSLVLIGCKSEQQTVAPVPPPSTAQPEAKPLPPVSLQPVAKGGQPGAGAGTGVGEYEPKPKPPTVVIEPSPDPEPLPPVKPAVRTYTLKKGDSFWKIAKREYGDPLRWVDIAKANPTQDPKKLVIGDEIVLP